MTNFFNRELAELAHQVSLSPRRLRVGQLDSVQTLLSAIEPKKAYPFEFVCFRITGYHKRGPSMGASIPGKALIADLVSLAEYVSRKANLDVSELHEAVLSQEQVADELKVSTKTIRRWRSRGLLGARAVCRDGVSRLVFRRSAVELFVQKNKRLVAKGAAFKQLTEEERSQIVERAREILADRPTKLHAVARSIADETGRAVETIRYTLRRHDSAPGNVPLFGNDGLRGVNREHNALWECFKNGEPIASLALAFGRSEESVGAIIRRLKAVEWQQNLPDYVHNELFDSPQADALILDVAEPPAKAVSGPRAPRDLPAYLRSLYRVPLLTSAQEQDLFRRYNYLKHKAARAIRAVDPVSVTDEALAVIDDLVAQAEEVRRRIVQANLRLVVSIAKKHVGRSSNFFEVVSDGNMSLMRAVERFDYALGNKFSTYASWAIMKNYARSIPEQHYHLTRYITGQDEVLESIPDAQVVEEPRSDRDHIRALIAEGMNQLTDREREIVAGHFGLFADGQSLTLEQLGRQFGVTKERVRQIERRALGRLHEILGASLGDTVTA